MEHDFRREAFKCPLVEMQKPYPSLPAVSSSKTSKHLKSLIFITKYPDFLQTCHKKLVLFVAKPIDSATKY